MNEELEMACFEIISNVGEAHSKFSEAVQLAKEFKFDEAEKAIEDGDVFYIQAHQAHTKLLTRQIGGEQFAFHMLITHAQDQLLCTETIKEMAKDFIDVYRAIKEK